MTRPQSWSIPNPRWARRIVDKWADSSDKVANRERNIELDELVPQIIPWLIAGNVLVSPAQALIARYCAYDGDNHKGASLRRSLQTFIHDDENHVTDQDQVRFILTRITRSDPIGFGDYDFVEWVRGQLR